MQLHLSRFLCLDVASNLGRFEEEARSAASGGAEVVAFPEAFLGGYRRPVDPAIARERFAAISNDHPGTAFVFGTITEERRNRLTIWQKGTCTAAYDKVHLFRPNGEDALWEPGDRYVAFVHGPWRIGLLTCNDIRFPEQARALRLQARVDLLLAVAWWPWRRDETWQALLRARAIENAVFCAGCCVAGSESPEERFAGAGNHVFDPLGEAVPTSDDRTYRLDRSRLALPLVDPLDTHRTITMVVSPP